MQDECTLIRARWRARKSAGKDKKENEEGYIKYPYDVFKPIEEYVKTLNQAYKGSQRRVYHDLRRSSKGSSEDRSKG